MKGTADMSKASEQGNIRELPAAEYIAEIVEVKEQYSQNDDATPAIKMVILTPGFTDCWVWDNITISNNPESPGYKILGRSKRFLHCIGQPYDGDKVDFDTDNWLHRQVRIKTEIEPANQYHKYSKAKVAQYILDEDLLQGKRDPSKPLSPINAEVAASWGEEESPL